MTMYGQTYNQLWKQADEAEQKDLPRTQYDILMKIVAKAQKEGQYGQLMAAELAGSRVMATIAPDSLAPAVERMADRWQQTEDPALKAVYGVVLRRIYATNSRLEQHDTPTVTLDAETCAKLAAVKAAAYKPLTVEGRDSRWFDDDMLSVVGYELQDYAPLHDYYQQSGNRVATMMTALELLRKQRPLGDVALSGAPYLQRLDSLIGEYGDLPEAGEVALERYNYMNNHTDATPEQLWNYTEEALSPLRRWSLYGRMNELRNARQQLVNPRYRASISSRLAMPGVGQRMSLYELRAIDELTVRIYSVKVDGDTDLNPMNDKDYKQLKPLLTELPAQRIVRRFEGHQPYDLFEDSLQLPALPVGVYMVEIASAPATTVERCLYHVSGVRTLVEALPGSRKRFVVVDAQEGQPVKGATIRLTGFANGRKQRLALLTTDAKGEATFHYGKTRPLEVYTFTDTDKACKPLRGNDEFYYYANERRVQQTQLMTDRAIYRPGQTVHVAAIAYEVKRGTEHLALKGKSVRLALRDANYKVVSEQTLTTDDYGTCATDFTLPTGGLTGHFAITTDNGSRYFRVEEYKRPTFEVTFDDFKEDYRNGDTITVRAVAKSYAGVPVQGAKVKYDVVRKRAFWWWSYSPYWNMDVIGEYMEDSDVADGETVTDGDGTFTVRMPMVLPPTDYPMFFDFVCHAYVTDQGGETHEATIRLPLGNRKTALTIDVADKMRADEMQPMTFHLRNAAGNDIKAEVKYRYLPLAPVKGGVTGWITAETAKAVQLPKLKSGRYEVEAVCQGDTMKRQFTVFALDDRRPAVETDDWFYASHSRFPVDGSPVTVQVGSSAKDVHIVYSIISGDSVIESGAVDRSNELINRQLTYKPEYGNGLLLTFAWVKQGKSYTHNVEIQRPRPSKELKLKWQTFRDRLTPGQQEEWSLTVTTPDGRPADAQLMATLYDKSLDQFASHSFYFSPQEYLSLPSTSWQSGSWGALYLGASQQLKPLSVSPLTFSHLDESLFPTAWMGREFRGKGMRLLAKSNAPLASTRAVVEEEDAKVFDCVESSAVADVATVGFSAQKAGTVRPEAADEEVAMGAQKAPEVTLRENLQETAFFYPRLQTDSAGTVTMKFTLPESLTTWRFIGLAHTRDLCHGMLTGDVVAKKDLMVQPNMPRFIREGDKATISARIINTSDRELSGNAWLTLIDPDTETTVLTRQAAFTVAAGQTGSVEFAIDNSQLTISNPLLIAKVVATAGDFSDGEQHYLPILPNRERVTVTYPFTQHEPGTMAIDLTKLFGDGRGVTGDGQHPNIQHPKLTVEYTNTPAWLMIQALPAIGHPHDDCAVCQAASLYANSIGKYIVDQVPQAKTVFEQWKRENSQPLNSQPSTLTSQLEKNQELKDIVLGETPWVADADAENEQRQRLADFFDENLMQQRLQSALTKLQKLQRGDGSWSWWPDMPGSVYMTVAVTEMMVRLNAMTHPSPITHHPSPITHHPSPITQDMLKGAFRFLGKEMVELVDEMKKAEKRGNKPSFPSRMALEWLYLCKLDGRQLPRDVQAANDYLVKLLKKDIKNQTIYEKAMTAIILDSKQYVKSLKEYTVYKEEMGRYYDTPRAGYSWRDYRIPTQVAAIEAIQRLTPDDRTTLTEMRRWLLQQKRTQAWDTPLNSVDAVYAFISEELRVKSEALDLWSLATEGTQEFATTTPTALRLDGKALDTPKATAGIGYVKTALPYHGEKTFTAEKTSQGTSWGAVYAQFIQPTSDISDQASGVSVRREILTADNLSPLTSHHSPLTVGNRVVVRLTITAERDLDFVQVQDKRAACMEPVNQLSGYVWRSGYYVTPRDNVTNYFFDRLPKGKHVIETEYYIDRAGQYETGTCTVQCAYASEYRGTTKSQTLEVK